MSELIKREDAIKACDVLPKLYGEAVKLFIRRLPSADRPQGDVDAVDILMREMHNLEQGYITIGEFDERIEPLRHLCYGRPQGEWIHDYHFGLALPEHKCSVCGEWEYSDTESNYCPHCGARMFAKDTNVPNKKGADDED